MCRIPGYSHNSQVPAEQNHPITVLTTINSLIRPAVGMNRESLEFHFHSYMFTLLTRASFVMGANKITLKP
jgi:hypothetical protein